MLNVVQVREIFHVMFLEKFQQVSDPRLYVLKGGVNLRLFFGSPRYSEDMDLDVLDGASTTLRKNAYKVLRDDGFGRALAVYGIVELRLNDPAKAKQTETTQRFRLRLVTQAGDTLPTKIEFSRRSSVDVWQDEDIDPAVIAPYRRLSFRCQHYVGASAVAQKIRALVGRPATQARDIFDLYMLYLGNHWRDRHTPQVDPETLSKAAERAMSISYEQYHDQVAAYLAADTRGAYGSRAQWETLQSRVVECLS